MKGVSSFRISAPPCHRLDDVKLVGPSLRGVAGAKRLVRDTPDGELREIEVDADYLRQSILDPNALVVDGYPENLVPPIAATFTEAQIEAQIEALVEFIARVGKVK